MRTVCTRTIFSFFFLFLPNFCGKSARMLEKKSVFCLVVRGVNPPYTLSGPTTQKKNVFYVCLPLVVVITPKYYT